MKKHLSKVLSIVLTSGILLSAVPAVSAAETNDIQLYAGDKVTYQVLMPETSEDAICAFQIETTYDASKLEFESLEWNEKLSPCSLVYGTPVWKGVNYVCYNGVTTDDFEFGAGEYFATVTYTVKEDMRLSKSGLDHEIVEICYTNEAVSYKTLSLLSYCKGETVTNVIRLNEKPCDVNGDGVVSIFDATAIQKHCADIKTLPSERLSVADINLDGTVNVIDATALQKKLVAG